MKYILIIFSLSFVLNSFCQTESKGMTLWEKRNYQIERIKAKRDTSLNGKLINPLKIMKLQKMGVETSALNFDKFEDRKQINLLFRTKKQKTGLLVNGIILNAIGTSLLGLGGNIIYTNRNSTRGFGTAIGAMTAVFGVVINSGSIPFHIGSAFKHKKYKALQYDLKQLQTF